MTIQELRGKYLEFFKKKDHHILSSASLVPENDPTTLFTGSGMQPMVPYLLGEKHPQGVRLADSQKCLRTQDIDDVGDNRHTTFFEMLGNWSLGDYFKKEQIPWMFEFVTKELGLDPSRLYVTCFRGNENIGIDKDEESAKLWQEEFSKLGIQADIQDHAEKDGMNDGARIFYYDDTKNWWSRVGVPANMPVGEPGGPDAEIFWDFGTKDGLHEKSPYKDELCHVNCECGRFLEIGNNVFMEYVKTEKGFEPLPQKNVDFGGGLERMAAAMKDNSDMFLIDIFEGLIEELERLSGKKYGDDEEDTRAFRIILDHIRGVVFLIGDGAIPSNKVQGYFTRRLMRRAVRYAQRLGITENFCSVLAEKVIQEYGEAYPCLVEKQKMILLEVEKEEESFRVTLQKGLTEFNKLTRGLKGSEISGKDAFKLYDTYGFPLEMTQELAQENELTVDEKGFNESFEQHQELSRQGAEEKFKGGLADHSEMNIKYHTATHLLHAALKEVLGDHVEQRGSNITEKRLRFDFSHPEKMTDEEKKKVENIVNKAIEDNLVVEYEEMTVEEAKEKGAIGLFGDKYDEKVKVYSVEETSKEICGGPHVEKTGDLGKFRIKKEESSSAGIRRIKGILE